MCTDKLVVRLNVRVRRRNDWMGQGVTLCGNIEDVMFIRHVVWEIVILATFTQCPVNVQHLCYLN